MTLEPLADLLRGGPLTDAQLLRVTAALVAAGMLLVIRRSPAWVFGPQADFWNPLRRLVVPLLDRLIPQAAAAADIDIPEGVSAYAAYELAHAEHVGRVEASSEAIERALYADGYTRLPLAALKTLPDGRVERGSWARRDGRLAPRQTHVMLFDSPAGETGVDVYAHEEYSAIHPLYAWRHYTGVGYDIEAGVATVRAWLDGSAFEWTADSDDADD